jgi:NADPH-dependent glutamate synthase beta subunit-like oxidoreductase
MFERLGIDFTIDALREKGYNKSFLGIGTWDDDSLCIDGEDLKGCWKGIAFLSTVASSPHKNKPVGKRATVIGAGNSAVDCARTLLRLGCEKVDSVYRRTRKEMPATEMEIVASEDKGDQFKFLAAPNKILGDDQNHVVGLEYLKNELGEPDASERRRPVSIQGSVALSGSHRWTEMKNHQHLRIESETFRQNGCSHLWNQRSMASLRWTTKVASSLLIPPPKRYSAIAATR